MNLQENLITETKYSRAYLSIIENAKYQNRKKLNKNNDLYVYYENHHILPKSIFPEYKDLKVNKWNGVLLTAREHFICHFLLMKHYKSLSYTNGYIKMSYSLRILQNGNNYNSKIYESIKLNLTRSQESNKKTSDTLMGRKRPQDVRDKISKGQQNMSDAAKKQKSEKCSKAKKGIKQSKSHIEANRNAYKCKGKNHGCALKIYIYNEKKENVFQAHGNFKKICLENNLPFGPLKNSYQNNGILIFQSTNNFSKEYKEKYLKFKNWYALIIN